MADRPSPGFWQQFPQYLIVYVAWIALSALGLWIMLQLRINLLDLVIFFRLGPWIMGAIDKFGILLLGLLWLVAVLTMEYYLRQGVEKDQVWQRVLRVLVAEVVLLAASYGLQLLMA